MKKIHLLTIAGVTAFSLVVGFGISNDLQNNVITEKIISVMYKELVYRYKEREEKS